MVLTRVLQLLSCFLEFLAFVRAGLVGIVTSETDLVCRVELHSSNKVVSIARGDVAILEAGAQCFVDEASFFVFYLLQVGLSLSLIPIRTLSRCTSLCSPLLLSKPTF